MSERVAERLAARLRDLDGVVESPSMFGSGAGFWCNGKEIAHFDAAAGATAKPPPTGADLARRRRFH